MTPTACTGPCQFPVLLSCPDSWLGHHLRHVLQGSFLLQWTQQRTVRRPRDVLLLKCLSRQRSQTDSLAYSLALWSTAPLLHVHNVWFLTTLTRSAHHSSCWFLLTPYGMLYGVFCVSNVPCVDTFCLCLIRRLLHLWHQSRRSHRVRAGRSRLFGLASVS